MAGGRQKPKINWSLAIQATMAAFVILVAVIGGFMGYAWMNGATAQRLHDLERRIEALEHPERRER